jgi:hypothetical protein
MPSEPLSDYARSFGTILWIICSLSGDSGLLYDFVRSILSARSLCGIDVTGPHVTCDTHVGLLARLLAWLLVHILACPSTRCQCAAAAAAAALPPLLPPSCRRRRQAAANATIAANVYRCWGRGSTPMGIEESNDDGSKGDGNGDSDKEGNGAQPRHSRHWRRKRDGGDNGDGEGDGTKDMVAHTMPGERGMMVAMGHGLCVSFWVSGEMTKKIGTSADTSIEYLKHLGNLNFWGQSIYGI